MSDNAILIGHDVVRMDDFSEWATWMERYKYRSRAAAEDGWTTPSEDVTRVGGDVVGDADVSTVFLGINHSFGPGPGIWFETMVFGGPHDEWQDRYSTWDEAKAGHDRVVAALREGREP